MSAMVNGIQKRKTLTIFPCPVTTKSKVFSHVTGDQFPDCGVRLMQEERSVVKPVLQNAHLDLEKPVQVK